jgi:hypothetical protein
MERVISGAYRYNIHNVGASVGKSINNFVIILSKLKPWDLEHSYLPSRVVAGTINVLNIINFKNVLAGVFKYL